MAKYLVFQGEGDPGFHELDVYTGTAGKAADFGIERYRPEDEAGKPLKHWLPGTGMQVAVGDRFVRRVWDFDDAGDPQSLGVWRWFSSQGEEMMVDLAKHKVEDPSDAGTNMVDRYGAVLLDDTGAKILQPGAGEQARDRHTGALLWWSAGGEALVDVTADPVILDADGESFVALSPAPAPVPL